MARATDLTRWGLHGVGEPGGWGVVLENCFGFLGLLIPGESQCGVAGSLPCGSSKIE